MGQTYDDAYPNATHPDAWRAFADALVAGACGSRAEDQVACLTQALEAVIPAGTIHGMLVDTPSPADAVEWTGTQILVGEPGGLQVRIKWDGPPAHQVSTETVLTEAAERLRPVIAAWSTLRRVSDTDALTGAGSRRALERDLPAQLSLAARHNLPVSVIALDADRFKSINDTKGHAAGDRALVSLVTWLRDAVRGEDRLYRVGGDEFVLVLPHTDAGGADQLAARISADAPISVSAGCATSMAEDTAKTLLDRADHELLEAKHQGGG